MKKQRSSRVPLWNKVPSYGVEALINSINDPQELILAVQSGYPERNSLGNHHQKGNQGTLKKDDFEIFSGNWFTPT